MLETCFANFKRGCTNTDEAERSIFENLNVKFVHEEAHHILVCTCDFVYRLPSKRLNNQYQPL